ncbi:sigma-70 family RNA polymerase sigma factor [Micromonospora chersina]|uniref:sigma-70 family RNA polymerase sigma factor n=1 Tax=Micromonospora chersina TaxID=47854 RepID=UPI00378ED525
MAVHARPDRPGPDGSPAPAAGDRRGPRPGGRAGVGDPGDGARQPRPCHRRALPPPPGPRRRAAPAPGLDDGPPAPGRCPVTAAVTAPARVPGQAGPPAIEQTPPPEPGGTWDLVVAAQAGDPDAYGQLYARYQDTVFRFIYFRCGNRHLAEDLTADTFVRGLNRIGSFTWQGRDIGAWFVTIARNLVADHFKSGRYRLEVTSEAPASTRGVEPTDTSRDADPLGAVLDVELSAVVAEAMAGLTEEQRWCLRLRFFAHMSVAEVAAAMGKEEGAVKALQYRAVRGLARMLPAGYEETR